MISLDNKLDNRTISDITAPDTLDLSCSGVCYDNQLPTAKRNGSVFFYILIQNNVRLGNLFNRYICKVLIQFFLFYFNDI